MAANPRPPEAYPDREQARALDALYANLSPLEIVEDAVERRFRGRIAAVSSFGADSAVLLHMIATVDRTLPVAFLDTGKHFEETLDYRDALAGDLGLTDVRIVTPEAAALERVDPTGKLHVSDVEACCGIRKVEPMARAVEPFAAWFTGRKRFQAATREALPVVEAVGPRFRINPLARWSADDLDQYMRAHDLRQNPLVAYGYLSIGCFPCTKVVAPGDDARSGRWAGLAKTECGIHMPGLDRSLGQAAR